MTILAMMLADYGPQADNLDNLLERISQEDKTAFEELYHATNSAVYGYALSILKNTHDAQDVTHDCFVKVYHAADNYKSQGKPMAWLIEITKNLCLQRLRQHKDHSVIDDCFHLADKETVSSEDRLLVEACIKLLSDEERQIVVLHTVSGYKHREIAKHMGLALSTVLSKYNRALKKIKSAYERGELA